MKQIQNKRISRRTTISLVHQTLAILLGLVIIAPIIYALLISFMPANQILKRPPTFIPKKWILDNYKMAITSTTLGRFMINSLIMALTSSIMRVIISSMAAYALSFYKFKGRNFIFMLIMGTMMIPGDVVLVSNYQTVAKLGLINTYLGMMIIFFCLRSYL